MNMKFVAAGGTLLGLAVGAVAGYFVSRKVLDAQYNEQMETEINRVKTHLENTIKRDFLTSQGLDVRTPAKPVGITDDKTYDKMGPDEETLERIAKTLRYKPPGIVVDDARGTVTKNVFAEEARKPKKPYVITEEQYGENETRYAQCALVYYNGDDTLADQNDVPIDDVDRIIGRNSLNEFNEDHEVYVRNERLQIDYLVTRSEGMYSVEVQGD